MMDIKWILLIFALVAIRVDLQSVAPGDVDPYCFDRPMRIATSSNEKILLDTQDYKDTRLLSALGMSLEWLSLDLDQFSDTNRTASRWYDQSQDVNCMHLFTACGHTLGLPQNNWMITQYINISDSNVHRVSLNTTFTVSSCASCPTSFRVFILQTDTVNETLRNDISSYTFTGIRLFHFSESSQTISSASHGIDISSSGFYLAIVDDGSCVVMSRLVIYYNICPGQVNNSIIYPETVAPTDTINIERMVTGSCIDNASPTSDLQLICRLAGLWVTNTKSCTCNPGYEFVSTYCKACSAGTYKPVQGDERCQGCPVNSHSSTNSSTGCPCLSGYYRASFEGVDDPCTAPPSPPLYLHNTSLTSTNFTIEWTQPTDNGGRLVFYIVNVTGGNGDISVNVSDTTYTFNNLRPSTTYIVKVTSTNGVSDQDFINDINRTISITITTLSSPPTKPNNINLMPSTSGDVSLLTWDEPDNLYGTLREYRILLSNVTDVTTAQVVATITNRTFELSGLDIETGTYYIWVQAVTEFGPGEISTSFATYRHTASTPSPSNDGILPAVIGAIGGIFLLILIPIIVVVIILIIMVRMKSKRSKDHYNEVDMTNGAASVTPPKDNLEMMQVTLSPGGHNPNRQYIDPRNYSSMNQAFEQNSVKEIPPKDIANLEEIGLGEFGLVYKGIWTLKRVPVAVKTLRGGSTDEQRENFLFEASAMAQFRHPNVVELYGVVSRVDPVMIVMEFMNNGSLDRYLQKNLDKIGNERLTKMSYHAVQGMCYLSDIGFVHRDLAARNILVGSDETCKIADFGLARELVENEYGVNKGGRIPVRWTAPEAISHRSFTTASDVWSFGVLLWEMFSYGATPYDGWDNFSIFQRLENGERLVQPMGCPDDLYQLMLSCWAAERSERPTFDQLKECLEIVLFGKPKPKPKPSHLTSPTRPSNEAPPSSPPPRNFTDSPGGGMSIKDLLNNIGMNRYTEHFHNNGYFTVLDCLELTEDDLNRMGIILSGHQYKIVKNIRMKEEELGRVSPSSPY